MNINREDKLTRVEMRGILAGNVGSGHCDPDEVCGSASCSVGELACCCCSAGQWTFKKCVTNNLQCCQECGMC